MALLKSYSCRSCGGILNFDEDQEIFACPFCGEEFNYTDFHRDELLSQAATCLKNLRYAAAKDKYDTLLSYNPQDFEALRGLVLVHGRINSQANLKSPEDLRNCDFEAAIKASEDDGQMVKGQAESKTSSIHQETILPQEKKENCASTLTTLKNSTIWKGSSPSQPLHSYSPSSFWHSVYT